MSVKVLDLDKKFMESFSKSKGCWEWKGTKTKSGYGVFCRIYAHRFSFEKKNKTKLKKKQVVRHSCDNPGCVNPKHLSVGTQADNVMDAVSRGRNPTGENHNFNKFPASCILEIRSLYKTGNYTQAYLCKKFGMSPANLNWVVRGKIWKRLT